MYGYSEILWSNFSSDTRISYQSNGPRPIVSPISCIFMFINSYMSSVRYRWGLAYPEFRSNVISSLSRSNGQA